MAGELKPDLILMDIVLNGEIDGIEPAGRIGRIFNIPVVYLTAYADDKTLERAKVTDPFGYMIKPFGEKELHSTVEMAIYKHRKTSGQHGEGDRCPCHGIGDARPLYGRTSEARGGTCRGHRPGTELFG